jgi:hypothetical protein
MVFDPRKHNRPMIFWDAIGNIFWPWAALRLNNKRGLGFLIFSKKDLEFLIEVAKGDKEE